MNPLSHQLAAARNDELTALAARPDRRMAHELHLTRSGRRTRLGRRR